MTIVDLYYAILLWKLKLFRVPEADKSNQIAVPTFYWIPEFCFWDFWPTASHRKALTPLVELQLKVKVSNKYECVIVWEGCLSALCAAVLVPACCSPPSHLSTLPRLQFSRHSSAEKAADLHNVAHCGGDFGVEICGSEKRICRQIEITFPFQWELISVWVFSLTDVSFTYPHCSAASTSFISPVSHCHDWVQMKRTVKYKTRIDRFFFFYHCRFAACSNLISPSYLFLFVDHTSQLPLCFLRSGSG